MITEEKLIELRARNKTRADAMKVELGEKYALHAKHRVLRKDLWPGVLSVPRFLLDTTHV